MKKSIIYILIALTIFSILILPSCAKNNEYENAVLIGSMSIDGKNITRYQDQLIHYTKNFERNEFGYEILVEKGTNFVIDAGVCVELTDKTYILSGNGKAADFLKAVRIGDIVIIANGEATIKRDPTKSNLKKIEIARAEVDEFIEHKITNLYDVDAKAIAEIDVKINTEIENFSTHNLTNEEIDNKVQAILALIDQKYYLGMESYTVEGRGLWHRPNATAIKENSLLGLQRFVNSLDQMGINVLYVETLWHGMTTYYSEYMDYQHPRMKGYDYGEYGDDYILALISECHKKGH